MLHSVIESQNNISEQCRVGFSSLLAAQSRTKELLEESIRFGRSSSYGGPNTPEGLKAKKDAICLKGYLRYRVVSSFNGFGNPEYAYPGPTALNELVHDSVRKILLVTSRETIADAGVKGFCKFETTATRAGITAVSPPGVLNVQNLTNNGKKTKLKTVRERVEEAKLRVHDAATKEAVYAWMQATPTFSAFIYNVSVDE